MGIHIKFKFKMKQTNLVYGLPTCLNNYCSFVTFLLLSSNGDPYIKFMIRYENNIWVSIFTTLVNVYMFANTQFYAISLHFFFRLGMFN